MEIHPSGIDNNIVTYGGFLVFNKLSDNEKIQNFNFPYKIFLIDSGVEKNTKRDVEKVKSIV